MLAHFKRTIPGFSTVLVDRLDWATMNEAVLRDAHVQIHEASVKSITEAHFPNHLTFDGELGPFGFKLDLEGSAESVYAYEVVVCAGTGGTTTPGDINFNLDNAQNLAIFVCVTYPNIPASVANTFVDEIVRKRNKSSIGFTDREVKQFKQGLARKESEALRKVVQV